MNFLIINHTCIVEQTGKIKFQRFNIFKHQYKLRITFNRSISTKKMEYDFLNKKKKIINKKLGYCDVYEPNRISAY